VTGITLIIGDNGEVNGYWLVSEDGSVHPFGQAPYWGNAGVNDSKVTSIVSFPATGPTRGYAWVFDNGDVRAVHGTN
jgi:hypothetical protein